ncbi:MAG: M48 family metallopeptidase [Chloroflexi bacterium]|nr:M48 family metallopeptidase [Chloroflexota bacterium]
MTDPATRPGAELPAWTIRRSTRARRARIVVSDAGEVVVVLPQRAPIATAERMVRDHAAWIGRTVARVRARHAQVHARPTLAEGRALMVNGIPHVVEHRPGPGRTSVIRRLDTDDVGVRASLVVRAADEPTAAAAVDAWLRQQARIVLTERCAALAPALGVRPTRISVRDTRSRWGSAAVSGSLSFSWRLILAPPWVLDTVVVHELVHLRHANHGPAFQALLRMHAPRADEARRWLREHRHELRTALDDGEDTRSVA